MPIRGVKTPTGGTRRRENRLGNDDGERLEVPAGITDDHFSTSENIASMHLVFSNLNSPFPILLTFIFACVRGAGCAVRRQ